MPPLFDDLGQPGVQRAYDTVAGTYADYFPDTRAESPLELAVVDAFAAAVTAETGARVLDAGCGAGRMSRYLADRGCAVQGVDLSRGMVDMARRDHPDLEFSVASLTELPFPDDTFAGVMVWYSAIHTPPEGQPLIFAEVARVLRPGGHFLIGLQAGEGTRDVSAAYARFGHDVELERHLYTADDVASLAADVGLAEVARLVRRPRESERDDQAALLMRSGLAVGAQPSLRTTPSGR
ncbi:MULTISPECIES: class I SAM-dependent methyltransferase [unclassified Knoellia]|uniref:class I SAM-dependent methyltransferase n=1 Tax=Knoellia altitudinis TaxID=3404795 RepID=UPI00361D1D9A